MNAKREESRCGQRLAVTRRPRPSRAGSNPPPFARGHPPFGRPRPAGPRLPTGTKANRESPRVGPRDRTPPQRHRSSPRLGRSPKESEQGECMRLHRRESICRHTHQQAISKHSVCQSRLGAIVFRISTILAYSSRRDAPDPNETYSPIQDTESPCLVDPSRPPKLLPVPGL